MTLTHEQIRNITLGAAYVDFFEGTTRFHRFTKEQEMLYETVSDNFYNKAFANSCVRLEFKTDSSRLFIKAKVTPRSSRRFYSHDVLINGKPCGTLYGNRIDIEGTTVSKEFILGEKGITKSISICLPWSCSSDIIELSLDDNATLLPIKKDFKILCYGDSITQGYDALSTSNSYASKLTTEFDAETRNKGIGGEIFRPELARLKDNDFEPNIITIAYGTNDWGTEVQKDTFVKRVNDFFEAVVKNYPNAKVFVIAPIWRADWQDSHTFGEFKQIKEELLKATNKHLGITLIDGFDFVPKETELFSDKYLHPNDEGFEHYAKNLINELKKHI